MPINSNNLDQIIKDKCRKFLNKKSEAKNYHPLKYFNDEILSRVIHWLVYESELSKIILKFVGITENTGIFIREIYDDHIKITVYFNGIEPEFSALLQIYTIINIPHTELDFSHPCLPKNIQTIEYRIADEYLNQLMDKYIPQGLYKYSSLFQEVRPTLLDIDDVRATQCKDFEYPDRQCAFIEFRRDQVSDLIKAYFIDFINDPSQDILQINDPRFLEEFKNFLNPETNLIEMCKGIRLYKLPSIDYSQEYALIEKICARWQVSGEYYEEFMTSCTSAELSPDNYLELYATQMGFDAIFKEILNAGGLSDEFLPVSAWIGVGGSFYLTERKLGAEENTLVDELRSLVIYEDDDSDIDEDLEYR